MGESRWMGARHHEKQTPVRRSERLFFHRSNVCLHPILPRQRGRGMICFENNIRKQQNARRGDMFRSPCNILHFRR
jgi:hypothetical protein